MAISKTFLRNAHQAGKKKGKITALLLFFPELKMLDMAGPQGGNHCF